MKRLHPGPGGEMKHSILEKKELVLITLVGIVIRLIDIARPFSGLYKWNEGHYATTALNYFKYGILLPMNEYGLDLTTPPLFTWLIYASFKLFGVHEWAARLPSLMFGILSVVIVYLIAEILYGKKVAVVSAFIATLSPGIVYFSRNTQLESMFTALSLAAVLFLIYYLKSGRMRWYYISIICLSAAIFTKYTTILIYPVLVWVWFKQGKHRWTKYENSLLLCYFILPLIPSILWTAQAVAMRPTLTAWYVSKPETPWTLISALNAFYKAVTIFIPEHFGHVFYYPLIISIPFLLISWRRHVVILIYTLPWLLLILVFPEFYLNNSYYHYSMLYGMAILLAYSTVTVGQVIGASTNLNLRVAGLWMLVLIMFLSIYQYNSEFHSYYTDFSKANETVPFYSAKLVASENVDHALVVADLPMTMFYLGGDPEYVKLAYTTQGLINAVEEEKYTYLVTYYEGNRTLREVLEDHDYFQIAPRAWKRPQN
jgi:4-amino-4-deoxy-L-arabinose transferase-like glycosyltransferase